MKSEALNNSNDNVLENINAEWFKLKEVAKTGQLSFTAELKRKPEEREKFRRRGKRILAIVNQMPNKHLSDEEKTQKIQRVRQSFARAGMTNDLEEALSIQQRALKQDAKIGKETFAEQPELSTEEERSIEELRERVVDLSTIEPGALAESFPSRNYLYHGSTTERIEKIFATGGLKNGVALQEDDPNISAFQLNSGFEGLSWSLNEIDALPGTKGHIAGFVAAPEDILNQDEQLVIPSRPAPYEVLQVNQEIDPEEFYAVKNQLETWGDGSFSLSEQNSVVDGLQRAKSHNKHPENIFMSSAIYSYDGDTSAERLRQCYKVTAGDEIIWDEDLRQQGKIPPALPWMQSLIDRGTLARNGYEDLDTVKKIVARTQDDPELLDRLIATAQTVAKPYIEKYDKMVDKASAIRVKPEEMYFVTSHGDLDDWLKVMARTRVKPKGILLYDDKKVVLDHFASKYDGNERELSAEIGRAIDVDKNFWQENMKMDPEKMERSGHAEQVLLESEVRRDKIIKLENGKLTVK